MNLQAAEQAITAILTAIDDDQLPKGKVRRDGKETVVQFGPIGYCLGSATRAGVRDPLLYRERAVREAIQIEAVYRADARHFLTEKQG